MPAEENELTNKASTEEEDCKDCTTREGPLDTLARSLANGNVSRRRALRLLGGALVGGLLGAVGVGRIDGSNGEAQAQTCAGEGQRCRSTPCCEGLLCINGVCTSGCPAETPTRCTCPDSGAGANIGTCVNTQTDINNCGACCTTPCPQPTGPDAPCRQRACVNGACTTVANPGANGQTCETGNLCTADVCQNGTCTQGPVNVTCPTSIDPCKVNVCNPATGNCESQNAPNNTPCETGNLCTADVCQNGTCTQGPANVTCPTSTDPCKVNVCDPATGDCVSQNAPNGTTCDDGNPCTTGETCLNGTCQGGTTVANCCRSASDCPTPTNPCQQATCVNNTCGVENKPNNTSCDLLGCRSNETCLNGVCQGGTSTCSASSQNSLCCGPGTTQQGQCKRPTGTNCTQASQCCNSCVSGKCT